MLPKMSFLEHSRESILASKMFTSCVSLSDLRGDRINEVFPKSASLLDLDKEERFKNLLEKEKNLEKAELKKENEVLKAAVRDLGISNQSLEQARRILNEILLSLFKKARSIEVNLVKFEEASFCYDQIFDILCESLKKIIELELREKELLEQLDLFKKENISLSLERNFFLDSKKKLCDECQRIFEKEEKGLLLIPREIKKS